VPTSDTDFLKFVHRTSGPFVKANKTLHTTKQAKNSAGVSYSLQAKGKKEKVDAQFGSFERHTKGIGE